MGAEIVNHNYDTNNSSIKMAEEEDYQLMEGLEDDFSDSQLVQYVRQALKSVALGDKDNYSELVSLLHDKKRVKSEDVALLVTSLKAISGAVLYIDAEYHESLLTSIFSMSMWNYGPDVMDALIELITSLAASSGKYVDSCLDMLVSNFSPPVSFLEILKLPYGSVKKEQVLNRVHTALECIAGLVPLAPSRLLPIVTERVPTAFQRIREPAVVMFVENVFKLENSAIGELIGSGTLISAVVNMLIDFDVDIDWKDIVEENPSKGIFDMELEDEHILDDIDDEEVEFSRESLGHKRLGKNEVADKLEKLDSVMVLTFEHLKLCKKSGRLIEVFESFLQSFEMTVLPAYKSKFAQFVMFYACSLDPESCGKRFAEFLADMFFSSQEPKRMNAVAYLASYLSRARFLSTSFVTDMLERLVQWGSDYCGSKGGAANPEAHKVFYAGSQAIMYILCFHMRSIMDTPCLKSQLSDWPLRQILTSRLEPLKVCLPSIVQEFLEQANSAHLLDRSRTPVYHDILESEFSMAFGGTERLDSFFPFDPCLLRKSDRYIRPNFIYWSMVKKTYDEDVEGSSDEEVDVFYPDTSRAVPQDIGIAGSFEEDDYFDDFNDSLNKMSITPKDSLLRKSVGELRFAMQMPSRLRPSMSPESL